MNNKNLNKLNKIKVDRRQDILEQFEYSDHLAPEGTAARQQIIDLQREKIERQILRQDEIREELSVLQDKHDALKLSEHKEKLRLQYRAFQQESEQNIQNVQNIQDIPLPTQAPNSPLID